MNSQNSSMTSSSRRGDSPVDRMSSCTYWSECRDVCCHCRRTKRSEPVRWPTSNAANAILPVNLYQEGLTVKRSSKRLLLRISKVNSGDIDVEICRANRCPSAPVSSICCRGENNTKYVVYSPVVPYTLVALPVTFAVDSNFGHFGLSLSLFFES